MRRPSVRAVLLASSIVPVWVAAANGCSAGLVGTGGGQLGGGFGGAVTGGHDGGGGTNTIGMGGNGGGIIVPDSGKDATGDVKNPCGSKCGDTELCDPEHLGLDDNCNGVVDENCPCIAGQAHFCFKGDPSYRGTPGCFDGVEKCGENGTWGPCIGGVHATDGCFHNDTTDCHPIQTYPFVDVDLKTGTGNVSLNAVTESWSVACPPGVSPCPAPGPTPPSNYKPLQSGQYTVTYQATTDDGGMRSCDFLLFVGAPGLRVELSWEHPGGAPCTPATQLTDCPEVPYCPPEGVCFNSVDLDLHVHNPGDTSHWGTAGTWANDCTWANCALDSFLMPDPTTPHWFPDTNMVPDPVNLYKDPVMEKNTCYYDPRGVGQDWQNFNMGCHDPRLDVDDIDCLPSITDPNDPSFCTPENINIDYPPKGVWTRIGVFYFSANNHTYDVHPEVKVYCNGALAADLGADGYDAPVTFHSSESSVAFWEVGDVIFPDSACATAQCTVQPLYADATSKTPLVVPAGQANGVFGPPYPPIPP